MYKLSMSELGSTSHTKDMDAWNSKKEERKKKFVVNFKHLTS